MNKSRKRLSLTVRRCSTSRKMSCLKLKKMMKRETRMVKSAKSAAQAVAAGSSFRQ
jgi:hypothetical protein